MTDDLLSYLISELFVLFTCELTDESSVMMPNQICFLSYLVVALLTSLFHAHKLTDNV
jgi:hypothetical protein